MSFSISIMLNKSEPNKLTKVTSTLLTLTGSLRAPSSIIDPIITCECDLSSIATANYLSIPSFSRFYFITDMVSISSSLVEIHAHVDVLSSFATSIRACKGIISKQENLWNLYLNDGSLRVYQNSEVITRTFPNGFPNTGEIVLAVAGS